MTDDDVQLIIDYSTDTDEFENKEPLNEYRSACNETVLVSKCPHVIADDEKYGDSTEKEKHLYLF